MKSLLVPVDGSVHAHKAVEVACDLATCHGGRVLLMHVLLHDKEPEALLRLADSEHLEPALKQRIAEAANAPAPAEASAEAVMRDPNLVSRPLPDELLRSVGEGILAAAEAQAKARNVAVETLEIADGTPADLILESAGREHVDSIVLGSRGLGELDAMTFGSVSHQVCQRATCTVVSVK